MISAPTQQPDGTLSYRVQSPYQQAETQIHVLIPENEPQGECAGILYVLPVEPFDGMQCGDALAEIRTQDIPNKHRLICVKPTFSHAPWYADHPSDAGIQQERHFLDVVVPFVDQTYGDRLRSPRRLLLGFSKSGWGAFSLLLRHPEVFEKAAAFDAPLAWESPTRYGMSEVFGTQANFNKYCVVDLLKSLASELSAKERLGIYGFSDFRGQHQFLHYFMLKLKIPHEYEDGPERAHRWDSGWIPQAVRFLAKET
jgi:hypothetical protein